MGFFTTPYAHDEKGNCPRMADGQEQWPCTHGHDKRISPRLSGSYPFFHCRKILENFQTIFRLFPATAGIVEAEGSFASE